MGLLPDGAPPRYGALPTDSDEAGERDRAPAGAKPSGLRAALAGEAYSFTRAEAFRTVPVWLLMFDGFCGAIIGVGCSQSLLQARPALS